MRRLKVLLRLFKGLYDILAGYLLAWVLFVALTAWAYHALLSLAVTQAGFDSLEQFWRWVAVRSRFHTTLLRLCGFATLHAVTLWSLRPQIARVQRRIEAGVDAVAGRLGRFAAKKGKRRKGAGPLFSIVVTLVLVPFVVQPTLVPLRWNAGAWTARAANLVDGTASAALADSVVGLYRKLFVQPVAARGMAADDYDREEPDIRIIPGRDGRLPHRPRPMGRSPMMDRWDPQIRAAVGGDRRRFAQVKAFMYTESAGRQFAVSRTGCAGLMQFCTRTARSGAFGRIFGVGQVYPCRCDGVCRVPSWVRRTLETGDAARINAAREAFVCDATDARFDGAKSIRAGELFIRRLSQKNADNIYLMYIGYNSGPAVSARLMRRLSNPKAATLDDIEPLLADALRPYFGNSADHRARSLLNVHLPKIMRAYRTYHRRSGGGSDAP